MANPIPSDDRLRRTPFSVFQELEDPRGIAWSLEVAAGLLAADGHDDGAALMWAASAGQRQRLGASLPPNIRVIQDRYIEAVKASLGKTRFQTACESGRAMAVVDAIALARQQARLTVNMLRPTAR